MSAWRPFDPSEHGTCGPKLECLLDMARAWFPAVEAGSSAVKRGGGEITLRFRLSSRTVTIYAAPPGGYRRRRTDTWRVHLYGGDEFSPANINEANVRIRSLVEAGLEMNRDARNEPPENGRR